MTKKTTSKPKMPRIPVVERPHFVDNDIKRLRMRQNLQHVQNKLRPAEKRFSQALHQPLVHAVSEAAGKTLARPTGLLGGGLVAFVGSFSYLVLSHQYDISYNYTFFFLFFIGGYMLGLASEYGLHLLHKLRR